MCCYQLPDEPPEELLSNEPPPKPELAGELEVSLELLELEKNQPFEAAFADRAASCSASQVWWAA